MANMGGMGMLLKSLGVDPIEIEKAATEIPGKLKALETRFENLENKIERVLAILENSDIEEMPDDGIGPATTTEGDTVQ